MPVVDFTTPHPKVYKKTGSTPLFRKTAMPWPEPNFWYFHHHPKQFVSETHRTMQHIYGEQIFKHLRSWGGRYMIEQYKAGADSIRYAHANLADVFAEHAYECCPREYLGNAYDGDSGNEVLGIMLDHLEFVCGAAAESILKDWTPAYYEAKRTIYAELGGRSKRVPVYTNDEVLEGLKAGMTNKAIAEQLGCNVRTISRRKRTLIEQGLLSR